MTEPLTITKIEVHTFEWETHDLAPDDYYNGFNLVYKPGARLRRSGNILTIHTDAGITGEFVGGGPSDYAQMGMFAHYLIGKDPLERELILNDVKRGLRKVDRMGMGPVDIALWDIAGKVYGAPVWELLGGWKKTLPAYASTYHGDENGGLSTPEAFADFAEQCYALGYRAFKIHGWSHAPIEREIANVLTVGKRVGDRMALLIDPACEYETFGDALRVGRAGYYTQSKRFPLAFFGDSARPDVRVIDVAEARQVVWEAVAHYRADEAQSLVCVYSTDDETDVFLGYKAGGGIDYEFGLLKADLPVHLRATFNADDVVPALGARSGVLVYQRTRSGQHVLLRARGRRAPGGAGMEQQQHRDA